MTQSCCYYLSFITFTTASKCIVFSCTPFFVQLQLVFNWPKSLIIIFKITFVIYIHFCKIWTITLANVYETVSGWLWTPEIVRKRGSSLMTTRLIRNRTNSILSSVLVWKTGLQFYILSWFKEPLLFVIDGDFILVVIWVIMWYSVCLRWGSFVGALNNFICFRIYNISFARLSNTEWR